MRSLVAITLISLAAWSARAQSIQLSPDAQISMVTCGPDQAELYSSFGHTAIRVFDRDQGIDVVYNYGVFDFDQPNFYMNFARGYSLYKLAVMPYPLFRDTYIYYNRFLHEQVLSLTDTQKQIIFDFLQWNAKPENASYLYDYFYDNCATRARDVFANHLEKDIQFDSSFIQTDLTIRQLTDLYLQQQPWGDLGIDICLGLPMDKKASAFEYMFLPDYVEYSLNHASIRGDSAMVPLVAETISVYDAQPEEESRSLFHPWVVLGTLFLVVAIVSILDWRRNRLSKWLDVLLFGATGIIGWLLLFLWFATNHKAAAQNFNLFWALPTHIIVVTLMMKSRSTLFTQRYFSAVAIVTALLLGFWFLLPQQMNNFLLPLCFAILTRALVITLLLRKRASTSL